MKDEDNRSASHIGGGLALTAFIVAVALKSGFHLEAPSLEAKIVVGLVACFWLVAAAHAVGGLVRKRIKLPELVGWPLLGIALTNVPGLKGLTHEVLHGSRFHDYQVELTLEIMGTLGVFLMIAKAGLETDLNTLAKNLGRGFVIAFIGVAIPGLLVFGATYPIMPDLSAVGRVLTAAIFTPTSLGVAAFLFAKMGILSSRTAQLVMAVAAIDDVIGLLILSGLKSSMQGTVSPVELGLLTLRAIGFFASSLVAGKLLAPTLSRLMARHLNESEGMRLMFALCSCAAFALFAVGWGLSPLMGAYAGGVYMTHIHLREFSGTEEHDAEGTSIHGIEHLLKTGEYIFVPAFVVSVGMKVDLQLFLQPRPIALLVVGMLVLVIGKIVAARFAGDGNDRATLTWGALVRGEVALVIALMGYEAHVIGAEIMSVAVMAMIVSIIVTSIKLPGAIKQALALDPTIFDEQVAEQHA